MPLVESIPLATCRKALKPLLEGQAYLESLVFAKSFTLHIDIVETVGPQAQVLLGVIDLMNDCLLSQK